MFGIRKFFGLGERGTVANRIRNTAMKLIPSALLGKAFDGASRTYHGAGKAFGGAVDFIKYIIGIKKKDLLEHSDVEMPLLQTEPVPPSPPPPTPPPPMIRIIKKPQTAVEFKEILVEFVGSMGLGEFFPPDSPFIIDLGEKAAALIKDETATLNSPEEVSDLTKLALYDTVIYCDDSYSMHTGERIASLKDLVGCVSKITTMLVADGIKVRFINFNGDSGFDGIRTLDQVDEIMENVGFNGYTPIGTVLERKILNPLLLEKTQTKTLKKPLLVTIVTDGAPNQEDPGHFRQVILNCKKTLRSHGYKSTSVVFQVSQVGDEPEGEEFIKSLHEDKQVGRMVYCTSEKLDQTIETLKQNDRELQRWLLELLLKGLGRPADEQ